MADTLNTLHVERTRKGPFTEIFVNLDPRRPGMPEVKRFRKDGAEWTVPGDIDVTWLTAQVAEYRAQFRRAGVLRVVDSVVSVVGAAVEREFEEILRLIYAGLEATPAATVNQAKNYVNANRSTNYLDIDEVFPDVFALLVDRGLADTADWPGLRELLNDVRSAGGAM